MDEHRTISTTDARRSTPRSLLAISAFLIVALAASCGGAPEGGGGQPAGDGGQGTSTAEEQALARQSLGEANAPVVLTEYGDYQ